MKIQDYGFRLLGRREYGVCEFRNKLQAHFEDESLDVLEALVQDFIKKGYLSEERYCESFIRDQILKKIGPFKIQEKLKQKGVEVDIIKVFLEKVYTKDIERDLVESLVKKKQKLLQNRQKKLSDFEMHQKVKSYLWQRGFGYIDY